jgi:hypothetical protein
MNRPLRILHTEAAKGMGGQEIYIFRHMQVMRARGHEVALLCQPEARLAQLARDDGFTVHTLRMGGLAAPAARHLVGLAPGAPRALRRGQHHQPP